MTTFSFILVDILCNRHALSFFSVFVLQLLHGTVLHGKEVFALARYPASWTVSASGLRWPEKERKNDRCVLEEEILETSEHLLATVLSDHRCSYSNSLHFLPSDYSQLAVNVSSKCIDSKVFLRRR